LVENASVVAENSRVAGGFARAPAWTAAGTLFKAVSNEQRVLRRGINK
jgi:hypothetical protein